MSTTKKIGIGIGILILAYVLILGAYSIGRQSGAADTSLFGGAQPTLVNRNSGVRVCTADHFNADNVWCSTMDTAISIADLSTAKLVFTGPNGQSFTSPDGTVTVSRQDTTDAAYTSLGSSPFTASLADTNMAFVLANIWPVTDLYPTPGTYTIEVDDGSTLLGTATFQVTQ